MQAITISFDQSPLNHSHNLCSLLYSSRSCIMFQICKSNMANRVCSRLKMQHCICICNFLEHSDHCKHSIAVTLSTHKAHHNCCRQFSVSQLLAWFSETLCDSPLEFAELNLILQESSLSVACVLSFEKLSKASWRTNLEENSDWDRGLEGTFKPDGGLIIVGLCGGYFQRQWEVTVFMDNYFSDLWPV